MAQDPHSGRAGIAKNLTLETKAVEILNQLPIGRRSQGRYISRLILEDQIRRDERARIKTAIEQVLVSPGGFDE